MPMKKNALRLVILLVLLSLLAGLSGCQKTAPPIAPAAPDEGDDGFTLFMDELFAQWVSADALSLNYFIADPESFGIERPAPSFGEVASQETIARDVRDNSELLDRLLGFSYGELDNSQRIVFDILLRDFSLTRIMESEEGFAYYLGYIRPIDGIQAQLPILLAEYNFRTPSDIKAYLRLLADTKRFFGEIIDFERERSRRGVFMSDSSADVVIENCESFLENREDNLLIAVFDDRMDSYEGLGEGQREDFKRMNRELVLENVLPAYEALLDAMRELRGKGANQGGLSDLPDGKAFAAAYLRQKTGTDRTPEEVEALLTQRMEGVLDRILSIIRKNPEIIDKDKNGETRQIADGTPEAYLNKLRDAIAIDFPAVGDTRNVVREVHRSLQAYVSPAFFLTPAIDRYYDNVIYINPPEVTDNLSLFAILAHEGYPGHMYQTVYYFQQKPHPIRIALENLGYDEGWATYAEQKSFSYAGLPASEAELLSGSKEYDLCFLARIDLGVNALGWGVDGVASFCEDQGLDEPGTAEELYGAVIGNPLLYLPYALGLIEISLLLEEAESALRKNFELVEFHRFLLDVGSAPFPIIREQMWRWISEVNGRSR